MLDEYNCVMMFGRNLPRHMEFKVIDIRIPYNSEMSRVRA